MAIENLFFAFILGTFAILAVLDQARPARSFEKVHLWRTKGIVCFALYLVAANLVPYAWNAFLSEHRLFDLTSQPLAAQVLAAVLAVELVLYVWHRTMHSSPILWRWFHQTHHSAERIDVWSAFLFHPLDLVGFNLVGSLGMVWLVGVSPLAAVLASAFLFFLAAFQHANLRTPTWLGYFIVRPEQHGLHHERGVHAYNYADLPIFDLLFGTFKNPERWEAEAGLYSGASRRHLALLFGRDLNRDRRLAVTEPSGSSLQNAE